MDFTFSLSLHFTSLHFSLHFHSQLTFVESYLVPRYRRLTFVESYLVPPYRRLTFVESYLVPRYRRKKFKNHLQFYTNILLKKLSSFFTGKYHVKFFQNHKLENIFEKSHRSIVILKNPGSTPQLVANFTPIRKLLCTFLYLCYGNPRPPPFEISENEKI